jgi:PAS domain S-box-containing protein
MVNRKDGSSFWAEGKAMNLLQDESVKAIVMNYHDITETKKAKEELIKSERKFKALVENSSDAITLMDEKGYAIYSSPTAVKMSGFTLEDRQKSSLQEIVPEESVEIIKELITNVRNSPGIAIPFTIKVKHKNGTTYWSEGTATNLLHDKCVNAIVMNYHDITETKKAKDELIKSEMRFKALVENSSDAITLFDASGFSLYTSPMSMKLSGYTFEERQNITLLDVIADESKEVVKSILTTSQNSPGVALPYTIKVKHKDGSFFWAEGIVMNLMHEESVQAFVLNYHDITETKKAKEELIKNEKRFRALVENAKEIITISDLNGVYSYMSPAYEKITGLSLQEINAKGFVSFVHPMHQEETTRILKEAFANPGVRR